MCLGLYPPLLIHTSYNDKRFLRTQIPYIKLPAPRDGSLHALTKNFFQRVDDLHSGIGRPTTYVDDYTGSQVTIANQIRAMARKIGRATCRERVSQTVYTSVVAVSIKTNTINIKTRSQTRTTYNTN